MHACFTRRVIIVIAPTLFACSHTPAEPPLEPIRDLTPQETEVAVRSTTFGLRLLQEILATEAQPNVMISPLSASVALGMALNGANGQTFEAMRAVLDYSGMSIDDINAAYRGLLAQLRARDPKVEFKLANSVWHERSFAVEKPFLDAVKETFAAEVAGLDFSNPASVTTINDWAARSTGNRIRQLIERIDPLDRLFLINAVYFKAPWTQPFEPRATAPRPFVTLAGATVNAPTMTQDAGLRHFTADGVQAVELLYADSAYSMVILAPDRKETRLTSLVQRLTAEQWDAWMKRFTPGRIMLFVPKFRFDYGVQMKQPLSRMGMEVAFQPRIADFRRINPTQNDLHISSVIQKSFLDVHELGTEAAAATAVTIGITSLPPTLSFDRPFLFAIRERSTGTLLFVGRIGDPTS
jgi:serine protease inhibitor